MTQTENLIDRILGPRNFASAMLAIQDWDRRAGSRPLLSEQIVGMKDGPMSWSTTHSWPSVRSAMVSAGLVRELDPDHLNGWRIPMTEITDLGREVRDALAKSKAERVSP